MGTVTLSRQIYPSCGLTLSRPELSYAENERLFGPLNTVLSSTVSSYAQALNHQAKGEELSSASLAAEGINALSELGGWGKNLKVTATWSGQPESQTGFVADLPAVDEDLQKLQDTMDHRYLNWDVAFFNSLVPSLENIAVYCFDYLRRLASGAKLCHVSVRDGDRWMTQITTQGVFLSYGTSFSVLHRHHREELDRDENRLLYGKCSRIHGHSYSLEVIFAGPIDETTGFISPPHEVESQVAQILRPLEGRLLNAILGNTSGELILLKLHEQFSRDLVGLNYYGLRLRETRKNQFSLLPDLSTALEPLSGGTL